MIVSILINTSVKKLNKVYDYQVKQEDIDKMEIGKRVKVSFGKGDSRFVEGIIVKIQDNNYTSKYKLKEVEEILDEVSYVDEIKLKLAKWMAYMYFCNVYDVLKLMLPPGTNNINSSKVLKAKQEKILTSLIDDSDLENLIEEKKLKSAKQIQLLKFLLENEYVTINDVTEGLLISKSVITTLEKNGYLKIDSVDVEEDSIPYEEIEKDEKRIPTDEQKEAIDKISKAVDLGIHEKFLLFGVTGSGKTEVYLQVIEKVLEKGKTVIVLVPEISLTHQTITRFVSRFGNVVSMLHSKMSISKRKDEYRKIVSGKIKIVIGARSAVFAPLKNLGMIIMDEEHDTSYYSQMSPRYSTKEVVSYITKESNAIMLLGSATPEVSTYYKALSGNMKLLKLSSRPNNITLPEIIIVDKKKDALRGENSKYFSKTLEDEIIKNKNSGEQSIVFLNKRGYSSYLRCQKCGIIYKCPNCDVALTYHKTNNLLICHLCSYVEVKKDKCYKCGENTIIDSSYGTEKIEEKLKEIDPSITTIRMDRDTTITKDAHSKILEKFKKDKIDILVGTQMVSKGHDIENVTLACVLGTDSMLNMNDYLASERAYNNISQTVGRAGRGNKKGRAIIETAEPENFVINCACKNDYESFYTNEINFRKVLEYPPFTDIFMFSLSSKDKEELRRQADRLYKILKNNYGMYKLFSPKVPFTEKINNKYRINIMLKAKLSKKLMDIIYDNLKAYEKVRNKKINLSITRNPVNF